MPVVGQRTVVPGVPAGSPAKVAAVIVALGLVGGIGIWLFGEGGPGQKKAAAAQVEPVVEIQPETAAVIRYAEAMTGGGESGADAYAQGQLSEIRRKMEPRHRRTEVRDAFEEGNQHMSLGQYAEAVPYFNEAVKLDPQFAEAHYRLGLAYVHVGNQRKAREEYRTLKQLDADLANLLRQLIH